MTGGEMRYLVIILVGLIMMMIMLMEGIKGDDEMDAWIDKIGKTTSSYDLQPRKYNYKDLHLHHRQQHKKSHSGRRAMEDDAGAGPLHQSNYDTMLPSAAAAMKPTQIVVAQDGSGNFRTVQAAVNSIPKSNSQRVIIYIKPGIYREKVKVDASWITFQGAGPRLTEIQWGDMASTKGPDGKQLGTFRSASVAINGDHFTAKDISFRNTAPPPPGGAVGRQAVALRISGDFGAFFNVNFYGAQDTLYDHQGRHYFYRCYIEGSIDFIFGNGRSFYYQCRLHSIASPNGSLTAQNRESNSEATGFSFVKCVVTGSGSIYLGRAWGPFSRVVYSFTYFDNIILPEGWFDWGDSSRQK